MPRKVARKERGIFEKESGSGIWWIRYKIDGFEKREKVGDSRRATCLPSVGSHWLSAPTSRASTLIDL
jgi:hypothetical protein